MDKIDEMDTILLKKIIVEARVHFDGCSLHDLMIEKQYDRILRAMTYRLSTLIPGEDLKSEMHTLAVSYPRSWWQMFKERYFTGYLKRKFPIKYKTTRQTVKFTAYNLYPKLPMLQPDCGKGRQIIIVGLGYKKIKED